MQVPGWRIEGWMWAYQGDLQIKRPFICILRYPLVRLVGDIGIDVLVFFQQAGGMFPGTERAVSLTHFPGNHIGLVDLELLLFGEEVVIVAAAGGFAENLVGDLVAPIVKLKGGFPRMARVGLWYFEVGLAKYCRAIPGIPDVSHMTLTMSIRLVTISPGAVFINILPGKE